ncbi:MAG: HipA N-terminal domain-containing protein [Acidobacteriota bacterium]
MRRAEIFFHNIPAGILEETTKNNFRFTYHISYSGEPVSLTMPVRNEPYQYSVFPSFFDGLLPEGLMLEALLRQLKIDRNDSFSQLCAVGKDMVGAVTVRELL